MNALEASFWNLSSASLLQAIQGTGLDILILSKAQNPGQHLQTPMHIWFQNHLIFFLLTPSHFPNVNHILHVSETSKINVIVNNKLLPFGLRILGQNQVLYFK